jgi:hypothetical protein
VSPDEVADELICHARQLLEQALAELMAEQEARIRRECLALHGLSGTPRAAALEAIKPIETAESLGIYW